MLIEANMETDGKVRSFSSVYHYYIYHTMEIRCQLMQQYLFEKRRKIVVHYLSHNIHTGGMLRKVCKEFVLLST